MSVTLQYPPCPRCEAEVIDLDVWSEIDDKPSSLDARTTATSARYMLKPCGHEVAGFRGDAAGVLEWHAERQRQ